MKLKYFQLAKKTSKNSKYKHQIGAIITYKGKVVAKGFNSIKTHPRASNPWNLLHAETSAIINSKREDFTDCSIYVYRETKTGKLGTSKPCKYCYNLLKILNFKEIYYSDYDGFKKEEL